MITQIFPLQTSITKEEVILNLINSSNLLPFDEKIIDCFSELSKIILNNIEFKAYPEIISFAFWIRKSNLLKIKENTLIIDKIILPRGLAFHITPSNVDIMFMYSWCLSVLAGNKNIVRISQEKNLLLEKFRLLLNELSKKEEYNFLAETNTFLTYPHNDNLNSFFSSNVDIRIVWGGDNTVQKFKMYNSNPWVKDIFFVDKFSYSIINCSEYILLDEDEKYKLASKFYNDTMWYNQKACSSPQRVFFVGQNDNHDLVSKEFWYYYNKVINDKEYSNTTSTLMQHMTSWYHAAAIYPQNSPINFNNKSATIIRIEANNINDEFSSCGGGFFQECFIKGLDDLLEIKSSKEQTVTSFGFHKNDLIDLINRKSYYSPCRIVPIGKALDFEFIWDGYHLTRELTKIVSVL